jgi:hypothetical protein
MAVDKSWSQYKSLGVEIRIGLPMLAVSKINNTIPVDGYVDKL